MPLTVWSPSCRVLPARQGTQLVVGLVNNMPDSALTATETQFTQLLGAAAESLTVHLRFCYLPEVTRGPDAFEHLKDVYWHIEEILKGPLDGLIVTGLEPRALRLADEPYWPRLSDLLDWAESHTFSSIWSCLAAHAAVQRLDGIERVRLEHKRFGVFRHDVLPGHPLVHGIGSSVATPHSRWNDLPAAQLRGAGYTTLLTSPEAGADLFIKQSRSLLVFFQGHPEYEETTLLREYRRDVGRYLRAEQTNYPNLPHGYFSSAAVALLHEFRDRALAARSVSLLSSFPLQAVASGLNTGWSAAAAQIYRNWLAAIAAAKLAASERYGAERNAAGP